MFVRIKKNKSGSVSIQIIDKSTGHYRVHKTIGSSRDPNELEKLIIKGEDYIQRHSGVQKLDFQDYRIQTKNVLDNIHSLKLAGVDLVLGKIFDEIGFSKIEDNLYRDLVLYRLIYRGSKLKTTEFLYRYEQKEYTEDDKWDGLKGYLTNSSLSKEQILENYHHLWRIEKAFRVAKTDLK